jgi:hypothetical protein
MTIVLFGPGVPVMTTAKIRNGRRIEGFNMVYVQERLRDGLSYCSFDEI